jgi:hypothetical protein
MSVFTAPQLTIVANRNVYGNGDLSAICDRGGGELEGVARVQSTVCESVRTRREQGEDSLQCVNAVRRVAEGTGSFWGGDSEKTFD